MKNLICLIFMGMFIFLNAQTGITNTIAPDGTFEVRDADGHILIQTRENNGWTGLGDAIPPDNPLHVSANLGPDSWDQGVIRGVSTAESVDAVGGSFESSVTDYYGKGVMGDGGYIGVEGNVYPTGEFYYYGVSGNAYGGHGNNYGVGGYGAWGSNAYGGFFRGHDGSDFSYGVYGQASNSPTIYGVYGQSGLASAEGSSYAVRGMSKGANWYNYGLYGRAEDATLRNYGVKAWAIGAAETNYAVWGEASGATTNWAGYFNGNVHCTGTLSKAAGSFKIDHPLDPVNKYLSHSFVESPDMMNIYNGNVELNYAGEAEIELPDWFHSLNRDFRYQLTAIGAPGPNLYVAQEVNGNTFRVAGGESGMKVSWQITGIRNDAYANANRIKVEEYKAANSVGKYLHPEVLGLPHTMSITYEEELEAETEMNLEKKVAPKDKKRMEMIR